MTDTPRMDSRPARTPGHAAYAPMAPAQDIPAAEHPLGRVLPLREGASSLVATIADWVGRDIIEGRLQPGDDLNTVDLARRFDTSRTPVREALALLSKEGLVEMRPRLRPRVAVTSLADIQETYVVRAVLHALVAERVATSADDQQLADLGTLAGAMDTAASDRDVDRYFWSNVAFHQRMTDIADNDTLEQILDSLGLRVLRLRHHSMSLPGRLEQSNEDHRRLARALTERDAILAGALSRSNVLGALAALEAAWPPSPGVSHQE